MNTIAEFTIIGRVGEIKQVGSTLRVSVASSFSRRDNSGEWVERTRWNEVTVFGEATRGYVKRNIVKGDLIFTSGSMGQTKWEKDGETFYGVTLACERIRKRAAGRPSTTRTFPSERLRPGRLRPPPSPLVITHIADGPSASPG
jgi:single-strand DNA-binding protein